MPDFRPRPAPAERLARVGRLAPSWRGPRQRGPALPGRVWVGHAMEPRALISPTGGAGEAAHTMHTCGIPSHIKSRAKAMKNKAKSCNTPCNTRAGGEVRGLAANVSAPLGPCGAATAPLGPKHGSAAWSDWRVSAPVGPSGAVWGRATATEPSNLIY